MVLSDDERVLVYSTFDHLVAENSAKSWSDQGIRPGDELGTPQLRKVDLATGKDTVLADGAYSAALRRDGAIAYARGTTAKFAAARKYTTDLVVTSANAKDRPVVWSDHPGEWIAAAWARDSLIAYRLADAEDSEGWTLVAFASPKKAIDLGPNMALAALSPDGASGLIVDQSVYAPTEESPARVAAAVISIADGTQLASLTVAQMRAAGVNSFLPGGDWVGDTLVVPGQPGVSTLTYEGNTLAVRSVAAFGGKYKLGAQDVRFTEDGTGLTVWAASPSAGTGGPGKVRQITVSSMACDRTGSKCEVSGPMDPLKASPVRNPSRPSGGPR